jgi:hypothetical protein
MEGTFMSAKLSSKEIRKQIGHPVIDADGHWLEFGPSISDYLKEVAGQKVVDSFRQRAHYVQKSLTMTPEERAQTRRAQEAFWGVPAKNTLDRATAMLPRLLYERLDEFGFDFTVLYPTAAWPWDTSPRMRSAVHAAAPLTCTPRASSASSAIA